MMPEAVPFNKSSGPEPPVLPAGQPKMSTENDPPSSPTPDAIPDGDTAPAAAAVIPEPEPLPESRVGAQAKALAFLIALATAAILFWPKPDPNTAPSVKLRDAEGRKVVLTKTFEPVTLVHFWATWCIPCRREMPALADLERKLGGKEFEVVAVNIDTRNLDKPKTWLKEVGITNLAYYADPEAQVFQDLKSVGLAFGMPATVLIDPKGCEIAYLAGPAEWGSDDAVKLVRAALTPTVSQ